MRIAWWWLRMAWWWLRYGWHQSWWRTESLLARWVSHASFVIWHWAAEVAIERERWLADPYGEWGSE